MVNNTITPGNLIPVLSICPTWNTTFWAAKSVTELIVVIVALQSEPQICPKWGRVASRLPWRLPVSARPRFYINTQVGVWAVSEAIAWLLWKMYTLQISLVMVAIHKIVTSSSPGGQWLPFRGVMHFPPYPTLYAHLLFLFIWRLWVQILRHLKKINIKIIPKKQGCTHLLPLTIHLSTSLPFPLIKG